MKPWRIVFAVFAVVFLVTASAVAIIWLTDIGR